MRSSEDIEMLIDAAVDIDVPGFQPGSVVHEDCRGLVVEIERIASNR